MLSTFSRPPCGIAHSDAHLVVGQTVDNDEVDATGRAIVVDDEVLAGVDIFVVVVPADFRRRRTRHRAAERHLATVRSCHVLQIFGEARRHQLLFRNWKHTRACAARRY